MDESHRICLMTENVLTFLNRQEILSGNRNMFLVPSNQTCDGKLYSLILYYPTRISGLYAPFILGLPPGFPHTHARAHFVPFPCRARRGSCCPLFMTGTRIFAGWLSFCASKGLLHSLLESHRSPRETHFYRKDINFPKNPFIQNSIFLKFLAKIPLS